MINEAVIDNTLSKLERALSIAYMTLSKINSGSVHVDNNLKNEIEYYDDLIATAFKISEELKKEGNFFKSKKYRRFNDLTYELFDVVKRIKKGAGYIYL
ncbi:MAG: hypothetical protein ACP6IU_00575 [Candidatus Asgardarchaeia archaeon]